MSAKILVTGATGNFGKLTIDFLLKKGVDAANISALVRDEAKASELAAKGISLKIGDYDNYDSLLAAFQGIDKLLLVSGTDLVNRSKQQLNAVRAAKEAGVKHIIYTSFERKNETETSPIVFLAQSHIDTDNAIKASGINYTIFRNNLYLDVLPMFLGEQVLESGIYFPAGEGQAAYVSRNDLAEAAANVLISDANESKEYSMNNIENYSFQDIAETLSKITNKEIAYISPASEEYAEVLKNAGVPGEYIGMFVGFAEAIKQGEFQTDSSDLEKLLGRKPASLNDFLKQVYSK
ncbi:NAD(P)H dehydrogenase (quinone) [Flavobacterium glycines]|uniref:NAD(P)-dependent oxidoreductase n=1 Tax=Flavobacterium glycines TaxID=551990 RepID=A0A1B9DSV9_9FLAO|nr:SDR family oxidoreductase [Flavobacterium glycines]OCB72788.1 NAD(P)-dependent oxidoreductase [Flavobacterium glycines]GEL11724.1 NAD(P)-dependent oxidoreductase [Flavobacterium glycines]SDJ84850.1 NAD(P)H dehydrogenase (quinone) [Flavobacterium glycines]